jgi:hypothetical protein
MLIDSVLLLHDGCCLDEPEDRQTVAAAINEVLTEYLGPQQPASEENQ